MIPATAPGTAGEELVVKNSSADDGTKEMLLSWFGKDELEICPQCGAREVLPAWRSAEGRICVTCGMLSPAKETEATG